MCEPPSACFSNTTLQFLTVSFCRLPSRRISPQFGNACVILRERLVSLCQDNLLNIAAKYNKSHIPIVPEGTAVIITVVALLEFGFTELKLCEAPCV